MESLISMRGLSREDILKILELTENIEKAPDKFAKDLFNKSLVIAFFEPSTRTKVGFSLAMQKMGGNVVTISEDKKNEAMAWGEDIHDTMRVVCDYADIVCLRHHSENLMHEIGKSNKIPLINCGNGKDEHPTQALIDLYTIKKEFGKLSGLNIAIVGDLRNMRSAHSLFLGLANFDNRITLISPTGRGMPDKYLAETNADLKHEHELGKLDAFDVVYMVGIGRKDNPEMSSIDLEKFILNNDGAMLLKESAIILSPLPRLDEIPRSLDNSINAKYFEQSKNGLYVRMAVLLTLLRD